MNIVIAFDAPAAISESLLAGHKVNVCPLCANSGHSWLMSPTPAFGQYGYWGSTPVRGKIIFILVNSPGCVSTSIEPPCCFTTMS